jgi:hypothetical protein
MDNLDLNSIIPLLQQLGVSPEQLGPERLERLLNISDTIKNPSDITPETSRQILEIIGIKPQHLQQQRQQTTPKVNVNKIGVNDPCPCGKPSKYKKCCGSYENQSK